MSMTPDAKSKLSKTIRGTQGSANVGLRGKLLKDLEDETKRRYHLTIKQLSNAGLDEAHTAKRKRLEDWIDEQVRAESGKNKRTGEDFLIQVVRQAAYTLLNRIVILRLMEAMDLREVLVVTGGWNSSGYRDFRQLAPALCRQQQDPTEGYAFLLQLVFEELAMDMPGLYGSAGIADLIPVPPETLRAVIEAFDDPELESCWTDDMTLGWVYQYWNDPDREALDAKINDGGKIEPHEIASKTQMFTERYMVDWLLQNSLGPMWLAMCRKHGWTPECESNGTLERLEQRRIEWRAKRDAGEVSLTDLMPLHTDEERRWAYYVPQPIPDDAIEHAPNSVREIKLIDPAVGSGHFLVVAFDLLFALYEEEARHRAESPFAPRKNAIEADVSEEEVQDQADSTGAGTHLSRSERRLWSPQAIAERILEHNLHGIDLDPRAVQIAAAALWLKAKRACPEAKPAQLNLVASNLRLSSLPDNDPALVELRRTVAEETGIPADLTNSIVHALSGADHLGSLLKVDTAVDDAIRQHEMRFGIEKPSRQKQMFADDAPEQKSLPFKREDVKASVLERLEDFLSRHTSGNDLGLRLRGEQLAAGVRFMRLVRESAYDLVVANPPYQGTAKMASAKYVETHYPLGKADLFAAFLLRGLELVRKGGVSSMLTMRNWMFIKQYSGLREMLLATYDLRGLGDFAVGAFDDVANDLLSVSVSVFHHAEKRPERAIALQPTPPNDVSYDRQRTPRKRAATHSHVGRHEFDPEALRVVPEWPLVYWWDAEFLEKYRVAPKLGDSAPGRFGANTGNNGRFTRFHWEPRISDLYLSREVGGHEPATPWVPYILGGKGRVWIEPLTNVIRWHESAVELQTSVEYRYGAAGIHWKIANRPCYFQRGVSFVMIGNGFAARAHRWRSVIDSMGSSTFPNDFAQIACLLNSSRTRSIVQSLNPTLHFQMGDVNRVPILHDAFAAEIFSIVDVVFTQHESHREPSVEFKHPGPSPWRYAQEWAQVAVDRPEGAPLPEYVEVLDPEPATDHLSFALGVALGRFGANGEGILDPSATRRAEGVNPPSNRGQILPDRSDENTLGGLTPTARQEHVPLPAGILFLDGTLAANERTDGLGHPAAQPLLQAWTTYGTSIAPKSNLRDYLREKFFGDVHRQMYENRPIHWPLSSEKKTFVAWINIHRWNESTLRVLLADHLQPRLTQLEGELADLRQARDGADKSASKSAKDRLDDVQKWVKELQEFLRQVETCSDKGVPPTDAKCTAREVDARYIPDLDDGVMINSAALWPLLTPQWKDPKKWWTELANAKGKKDYDWSHLAMRYWPTRVDAKCQTDPSLGVAHGCFWKYHPARAWKWELRLQQEIGPDFRIVEASYRGDGGDAQHRAAYLAANGEEALRTIEAEALRRRKKLKHPQPSLTILEPGLWTDIPELCWTMELRVITKQGDDFSLLAPDEPETRPAFEKAHPDHVAARKRLLEKAAKENLFAAMEDEEDDEVEDTNDFTEHESDTD
jgi:hypothetical protein